jgi:hypothetical protein
MNFIELTAKFNKFNPSSSNRGVKVNSLLILLVFSGVFASAQQISWTGNVDKISLFNNANWLDEGTGSAFTGSMTSEVPLNRNVYFGANATIGTDKEVKGVLDAGTGSIKFNAANIRTDYAGITGFKSSAGISLEGGAIVLTGFVSSPSVELSGYSQLHLYESDAISADTKINIVGEDAWVFFHSLTAQQVIDRYAKQISIDGVASIPASNCRITQYYDGAVVIPHRASIRAMYLYSGADLTGVNKFYRVSYQAGTNIGVNNTNKAASMLLKKGYMATIAEKEDGTGASKVYIAEDSDIIVSGNINGTNDIVSFVRVTPWRWITKKGIGGNFNDFKTGWYYNWGLGDSSVDNEFVAMQWGLYWPSFDTNVETLKTKPDVTHLLAFNEPDGKEQANMTMDQILNNWPKLMKTGLRLGSPAFVRTDSLYKFMDLALARGYRVDYMCLHSYEKRTGDNYVNTIYKPLWDKYQIPIWVTEFSYGAPWNTSSNDNMANYIKSQKDFVQKMDAAPFVERYALFAWSNPTNPLDSLYSSFESRYPLPAGGGHKSVLSARGIWYRDFESLPGRGNPLIYRAKISKAKQEAAVLAEAANYDNKCFSLMTRNNDGTSRRKIQISTSASKLNTAFLGGDGTANASSNESFLFTEVGNNKYKLKVSNNCLVLSVRNDSVVVEPESTADKQLWELVSISGTNFVALKNVATGKFINTATNSIAIGVLLTTISSTDISATRTAHWQVTASNICNCTDPELGVFDMKVEPLAGNAPLTVKMTGAKLTKENKEAFYRWFVFQGADTLISTMYNQEYTYTNPGTYRIQVRGRDYVSRNTTKEYTITVNAPSAVNNTTEKVVSIFPNPVNDDLNISGIAEGEIIAIYNMQGKLMLHQKFEGKSIGIETLPAGFYLLRCNGYTPVKLLKK